MLSEIKNAVRLFFEPLRFRIKTWHTAMRGWNEEDVRVLICLEDSRWYWLVLEWLSGLQQYICHWMDYIKVPKIIREIKGHWDVDDPEYFETWEQWHGDSLHSLWHVHICSPISDWVYKHKDANRACPQWELTLEEARKTFAHDPKIYEWVEKSIAEHKQWDAEKIDETRKAYAAGELTREQALEKLDHWFDGKNLDELLDGQSGQKRE